MLNPDPVIDTIVQTLQSIPDVVALMGGNPQQIAAHHDFYGEDYRLAEALFKMRPPAVLVAYDGSLGGNFDGATVFKHRFLLYMRLANQADQPQPIGYGTMWRTIISAGPVPAWDGTSGPNIRSVQLHEGLDLMDTPSIMRRQDEELMDFFVGSLVFPEIGDN